MNLRTKYESKKKNYRKKRPQKSEINKRPRLISNRWGRTKMSERKSSFKVDSSDPHLVVRAEYFEWESFVKKNENFETGISKTGISKLISKKIVGNLFFLFYLYKLHIRSKSIQASYTDKVCTSLLYGVKDHTSLLYGQIPSSQASFTVKVCPHKVCTRSDF